MLIEIITQIKNVIGGDNAFACQHVNPVGNRSRIGQSRGLKRDHFLQITQATRKHVRRRGKADCFRRAQEIHHVNRIETDLLICFRRPITKRALIVLPAAQSRERFFQLCVYLRSVESEIGFIRKQEPAECAACDLLATTVRKIF